MPQAGLAMLHTYHRDLLHEAVYPCIQSRGQMPASGNSRVAAYRHPALSPPHAGKGESTSIKIIAEV